MEVNVFVCRTVITRTAPLHPDVASMLSQLQDVDDGVGASATPTPKPGSPPVSPSSPGPPQDIYALLKQLKLEEFKKNFDDEGVTLEDVLNLSAESIKQLVPKIGPRSRLEAHIAAARKPQDR